MLPLLGCRAEALLLWVQRKQCGHRHSLLFYSALTGMSGCMLFFNQEPSLHVVCVVLCVEWLRVGVFQSSQHVASTM